MDILRQIKNDANEKITINLPKHLIGQRIEIIIMPAPLRKKKPAPCFRGRLKKYANSLLIDTESIAWQNSAMVKHANR